MAKPSDIAFFRAWCKQARRALDEGLEDAYIAAELIAELDDLIAGPPVDEVGESDASGGSEAGEDSEGDDEGCEDSEPSPTVRGLVRGSVSIDESLHGDRHVPRGTGSGAAAGRQRIVTTKRLVGGSHADED